MTFDEHYTRFMETEHARATVRRPSWDDFSINLAERSLHFVEGHKTKAENPHLHRLSTYRYETTSTYGRSSAVMTRLSPYVTAWLKTFEDDALPAEDAEIAARLAQLPEPEWLAPMLAYRTHAQEMAAFYRELDKANKKKPPLEWHPIPEERRELLLRSSKEKWDERMREKSNAAARKRGDIVHTSTEQTNA